MFTFVLCGAIVTDTTVSASTSEFWTVLLSPARASRSAPVAPLRRLGYEDAVPDLGRINDQDGLHVRLPR
jgi:hypothetical protein